MHEAREGKPWVVSVAMGYGHMRAAFPLLPIAEGGVIIAADGYDGIPESDRKIWGAEKRFYYFISELSQKGPLGALAFRLFDSFQKVHDYHSFQKELDPTLQLRAIRFQIQHGWGNHLIRRLAVRPAPLLTTFFAVAHMAEYWRYPGKIYVIVTDSDISRAWAPYDPKKSAIRYLAPTMRAMERLISYGVSLSHIFCTGFPLPPELVGAGSETAKRKLIPRLARLDPLHRFRDRYGALVQFYLGDIERSACAFEPPAILFSVGGAGAQAAIGEAAIHGLADFIRRKKIILRLAAGVSEAAERTFRRAIEDAGLADCLNQSVSILTARTAEEYFKKFNVALAASDMLWTKPSELSFYAALGMPIIMAPPVGSHEEENQKWLLDVGAGVTQGDPRLAHEWLPKMIESGRLASCAMRGFIDMERNGVQNIEKILNP